MMKFKLTATRKTEGPPLPGASLIPTTAGHYPAYEIEVNTLEELVGYVKASAPFLSGNKREIIIGISDDSPLYLEVYNDWRE